MVAHEQNSLIAALPPNGTACLNADDQLVVQMADHTKAQVIWFGKSAKADIRLARAQRLPGLGYACEFAVRGAPLELHLPNIIARHQLSNITAVLAIVAALESDVKHAAGRLIKLKPPPGRMRLLAGRNNARLLDDSYNASPESMLAALGTLSELSTQGRRIAILGDIDNLGAQALSWHKKIGERAAEVADVFIAVGVNMLQHAGTAALQQKSTDVHRFKDSRNVGKWLSDFLQQDDLVLINGSRAMHMEEVVGRLLANPERDASQLVS